VCTGRPGLSRVCPYVHMRVRALRRPLQVFLKVAHGHDDAEIAAAPGPGRCVRHAGIPFAHALAAKSTRGLSPSRTQAGSR